MRRTTPIQVIVIRDREDPLTQEYLDAIRQAFDGASNQLKNTTAYLSGSHQIGIPLLDPARIEDREVYRRALLGGAQVTVAVEILSRSENDWPEPVENLLRSDRVRRFTVRIPPEVATGTVQLNATEVGQIEPAFAPVVTALATLEICRSELFKLVQEIQGHTEPARLFISHAKADGMAMAHALVSLLNRVRSLPETADAFQYFYDAESIQPGDEWRDVLERHAQNSLFIALRTEEYESRYWCRKEYMWAERNHAPILVVDLRREMYCEASVLPFDIADTTRVSDGNLIRVLFHALRCHVDYLLLIYRIQPECGQVVLPRIPSFLSIEGACEAIKKARCKSAKAKIIYAGRTLPREMAQSEGVRLSKLNIDLQSQVEWEMDNA